MAVKATYFVGLLGAGAFAQSLPSTIVGCDAVDCPISDGSSSSNCTLVDRTFTAVGLARIPFDAKSPFFGLSWLEGVAVESDGSGRKFEKDFYLGASSDIDLSEVPACAIFFASTSDKVKFDGDNAEETEGICEDAMSKECVAALNKQAEGVNVKGLSVEESCSKVKDAILGSIDSACTSFASGSKWANVTARALSGSESPDAILSGDNSTSNCWPIIPKSDNLTLIESIEIKGDTKAETITKTFYGIVPILTVFFPGNSSIITKPDSQMTCMKTVGENVADSETKNDKDDNKGDYDESSAVELRFSSATLLGIVSLTALAAMLL
ncbi:hypothetical protein G7046_g428 [Stylonectria norvegica]|nr:hypothetical protein G7046_g428 [Stylonectria norvegica]